jgi:hypothetical protein
MLHVRCASGATQLEPGATPEEQRSKINSAEGAIQPFLKGNCGAITEESHLQRSLSFA